jgi:putative membrane protein
MATMTSLSFSFPRWTGLLFLLSFACSGCSLQHGTKEEAARFAKDAAAGGMAEVKLGELAQQRGNSLAVKEFGARMVADHSAAQRKLQFAAEQENISLPTQMNSEDRSLYAKLSGLNGSAFDQAYVNAMVDDHKADVAEFEKESMEGQPGQIRQFATDTLPTIKNHLDKAEQLQKSILSAKNLSAE